ncbi:hypothetical protein [Nannocystis sp.]|uniref:hypothetical protein n=1 Tax=Nannocystis sp. TaxID=1962667 RepID=UPI0025D61600|nr:hypothetical protein [Nannocystis sp.]MBK7829672.1 hypothetical protein [Nannocystis sp.]
MGSDFQRVKVTAVEDAAVIVQITERHPDMDAIHRLLAKANAEYTPASLAAPLTKLTIPRSKSGLARNFAAQLLADHGESPFRRAAERDAEDNDRDPDPARFIRRVVVRELKPLGKASNACWLYRATLAIELKDPELARGFRPGRSYDARACPTADWEL